MATTVILGASGGIGRALADLAEARGDPVLRLARPALDLDDEASFARAAERAGEGLAHVIVTTGLLHLGGRGPERSWREIDPAFLTETFRVNALLPALAAKHFLPRLARTGRPVFAVLTARVGSIADNRLGGWYGYRMAKAAANQLVRTAAIELARRNPGAVAVALHPGTVDTPLSRPFQRNLKPGQLQRPEDAATRLWRVIDALTPADTGRFLAWDGSAIPW
ncbi:SDR family oxidoreductase [Thermaurantiacus sp.]